MLSAKLLRNGISMETNLQNSLTIGVVARRSQIQPETLRVWEKRYDMISPMRTDSGRRLYSESDILKLSLVKQLKELGHSVSGLANLSIESLRVLLINEKSSHSPAFTGKALRCRLVFLNQNFKQRFSRDLMNFDDIVIVDAIESKTATTPENISGYGDVLIIDMATVNDHTSEEVKNQLQLSGCSTALVVFNFGTRLAISEMSNAGILFLKGSVTAEDIRRVCMTLRQPAQQQTPKPSLPPKRFSATQLARVVSMKGTIACECPNHLADLIVSLNAFEQYSGECANRNDKDAIIHAQLQASTAQARVILEDSLARLIEKEGILI